VTAQKRAYTPFGLDLSSSGESTNSLAYTGREQDNESGLYYYRARYYDPEVGRFISEDPLGFEAGINFYAYVNNNPVNLRDPMGLEAGDFFDLSNWDINRGEQIAADVGEMSMNLAIHWNGGDIDAARLASHNGEWDAWRHAEWQRQTSEQMNPAFAFLAGTYYELNTIIDWAIADQSSALYDYSFSELMNETWMDLSNNQLGRASANSNILTGDLPLVYGDGGRNGQPDVGFLDYNGVVGFSNTMDFNSAAGGFVLYPNRLNTNMVRTVYEK